MQTSERALKARDDALDALNTLKQYRGSDAYLALVKLLWAMDACYAHDLRQAEEKEIRLKQGGARQCALLADELMSPIEAQVVPKL